MDQQAGRRAAGAGNDPRRLTPRNVVWMGSDRCGPAPSSGLVRMRRLTDTGASGHRPTNRRMGPQSASGPMPLGSGFAAQSPSAHARPSGGTRMHPRNRLRRTVGLLSALALAATFVSPASAVGPPPVKVQILGLNDFHGQLEVVTADRQLGRPDRRPDRRRVHPRPACFPAGGVEYLATHVRNLRAENPQHRVRLGRRPDRRDAAAVGACSTTSRRSRPSTSWASTTTASATTSSTRASTSCCACSTATARSRLRPGAQDGCHPVDGCGDGDGYRGADVRLPRGQRRVQGHRQDDLPALRRSSASRAASRWRSSA